MKLIHKVTRIQYHRNGISGNCFDVVLFKMREGRKLRNMVATVFQDEGNVTVLDADMIAQGNITFGQNSFRGDDFEPELRAAINTASNVERFNWSAELPTTDDLTGSDPDFTGGLDSVQYLRKIRAGA